MKDVFSKIAFGFLMAQFVPGAVAVLSISMAIFAIKANSPDSITQLFTLSADTWTSSGFNSIAFLFLGTAAGMLIHGLHWAVIGVYENRNRSALGSFWHERRIVWQVLLGPIKIVGEVLALLFLTNDIKNAALAENAPKVSSDKFEQFQFVQEFYLHFIQFYAHTAYALVLGFAFSVCFAINHGVNAGRVFLSLAIWILVGLFFTISRIQMQSLYAAEEDMVQKTKIVKRVLNVRVRKPN